MSGTTPSGTTPSGMTPGGMTPGGTAPGSDRDSAPSGTTPSPAGTPSAARPPAAAPVRYGTRLAAAAATAVAVGFTGYALSITLLFAANGANLNALAGLSSYFAPGALLTAVVLFIAALAGLFRHWYGALAAGVIGAPIGILFGLVLLLRGTRFSGSLWLQMLGSLLSVNFLLWFFIAAAAPVLGPIVWRAAVRPRPMTGAVLLVRLPAGALAKTARVPAGAAPADGAGDGGAIDEQWDALVHAITDAGATTVDVPVADRAPDSVFVADIVTVLDGAAVLTAAAGREGEVPDLEMRLREFPIAIEHLAPGAAVSGGDVLVAGRTVYVAAGDGTDAAGVRELRRIGAARGYDVIALGPVAGRLTDIATALPDGTVLGDAARLGEAARLIHAFRPAPEPAGAGVLVAGDDTVLVSAAAPKTQALLDGIGLRTTAVDVSAFESLGGTVGRLAARLH